MKTKEQLNELKKRLEDLKRELSELTDEELREVVGGIGGGVIFTPTDDISDDTIDNILP